MIINGGFKIMGSKRVGLARTQALIQGLKRELSLSGATIDGAQLTDAKGVEMNIYSAAASADESGGFGDATGLVVPANTIITGLGCVVTTELSASTGTPTYECLFGTAAAGNHDLTAVNVNSLANSAATVAVGKGTSTHSHEKTAMGGHETLVFEADCAYSTSARTVFGSIAPSADDINGGGAIFWVTYRLIA
jgi:hypothetical protein